MQKPNKQHTEQTAPAAAVARGGVHLHECDEQEEGVGGPSDLLVQKPGQKGENPVLGGAAEEESDKKESLHVVYDPTDARKAT